MTWVVWLLLVPAVGLGVLGFFVSADVDMKGRREWPSALLAAVLLFLSAYSCGHAVDRIRGGECSGSVEQGD